MDFHRYRINIVNSAFCFNACDIIIFRNSPTFWVKFDDMTETKCVSFICNCFIITVCYYCYHITIQNVVHNRYMIF